MPQSVFDVLLTKFNAEKAVLQGYICNGQCVDYADYKSNTGKIHGIAVCEGLVVGLQQTAALEDKDDEG